ncbi:MAG: VCBS repeat-containing protein [Bacteroidales bacterium]|nr:VCBS repeat-containing protein [Bacteroidales bacterium]
MKKFSFLSAFILSVCFGFAQIPYLVNYQAIVRDTTGQVLANHLIVFQISINKGSTSGTTVFKETHSLSTNDFGQITLKIGNGNVIMGNFDNIDWGEDSYYLETSVDVNGQGNFAIMGASQIVSVPYALYSKRTESVTLTGPDGTQYEVGVDSLGNLTTTPINVGSGWTHPRYDLEGSNYYPYGSTIQSNSIVEDWSFNTPISGGYVLSGNVTGDAKLEIITVQNNTLYILSHDGTEILSQDIGVSSQYNGTVYMLEDFNNDQLLDIGVGYNLFPNYDEGKARIYDGLGNILYEYTVAGNSDMAIFPITKIGDDIIMGENSGFGCDPRGFARMQNSTQNEIWHYDVGPAYSGYSIADINSDGLFEMAYSGWTPHNGCTGNGTTGSDCWTIIINENGDSLTSLVYTEGSNNGGLQDMFIKPNTLVDDYKILSIKRYNSSYPGDSKIHIRDLDGSYLYNYTGLNNASWGFGWADIDEDGMLEIVATNQNSATSILYIFDEQLNVQDSLIFPNSDYTFKTLADVDGDGNTEILVSSSTDKIVAGYDHNLNQIWSWVNPSVTSIKNVIVSDNNQDGKLDICVLTDSSIYILTGSN